MRLASMPWPHVARYFEAHDTVIVAVGSVECHGKHLPIGTDTLIPDHLLERIEARNGKVLIAPTIPYGVCDYFAEFPGTIDLGDELLYALLSRVTQALYAHGARRFVMLNGHGGNVRSLHRVGHDLYRRGALLAALNWWKMVWDMNPAWQGGHGGGEETAAILAIDPALVDPSAIEADASLRPVSGEIASTHFAQAVFEGVTVEIPRPTIAVTANGWIGPDHPRTADATWGAEMLEACADYIVRFVAAFEAAPLPGKGEDA